MLQIVRLDYVPSQNKWRAKIRHPDGKKVSVLLRYDTFIDSQAVVLGQFLLLHWLGKRA